MNNMLSAEQISDLLDKLQARFEEHMHRHESVSWNDVQAKLQTVPEKLWSLHAMETTGGEPDVVVLDGNNQYFFIDCSAESPAGRRSICYDNQALDARKEHKPQHSAVGMAAEMGIEMLTEEQYRALQKIGRFDMKTSSWIKTPELIRELGGALFCDYRYKQVFTYHNGAQSYYAARAFRGALKI
jgi:hypothetical protein